jgi:hypothetical protein
MSLCSSAADCESSWIDWLTFPWNMRSREPYVSSCSYFDPRLSNIV